MLLTPPRNVVLLPAALSPQEAPIHVSNVMVLDSDGVPTRVGYRFDENGKKVRVSRRTGKDI